MSVWAVIGSAMAALPAFLKKNKKFVLWYHGLDAVWVKKTPPLSYRQCRKTRTALVAIGPYLFGRFVILREGVQP